MLVPSLSESWAYGQLGSVFGSNKKMAILSIKGQDFTGLKGSNCG
jgi:hypothetical protein